LFLIVDVYIPESLRVARTALEIPVRRTRAGVSEKERHAKVKNGASQKSFLSVVGGHRIQDIFTFGNKIMLSNPQSTTLSRIKCVIRALAKFQENAHNRLCFVYAMGGQTGSWKRDFQGSEGLRVRWSGSCLTGWLKVLSWLPSQAILVQIDNPHQLVPVCESFIDSSMIGVFLVESSYEQGLLHCISSRTDLKTIEAFVTQDNTSIIYEVDVNSPSADSDGVEFLHIGPACPPEISNEIAQCA
jgi:hypothetical protein